MAASVLSSVPRALLRSSRCSLLLNVVNVSKNELVTAKPLSCYSIAARSRGVLKPNSTLTAATCSYSQAITKGDKELAEFLLEEIEAEKKARRSSKVPKLEGFEIQTDGAEVTLTRKFNTETVTVHLNVNHSVDAEDAENLSPSSDKVPEAGEMKSKPSFNVEIEQNGKKLYFSCTFTEGVPPEEQSQDSYNDIFSVAEFAIYEGDWKDAVYTVSGDIMDGYLYDLLMNMLEERGISNEFADQLVEFCTSYEHGLYVELLEKLRAYVTQK